MLGKLVQVETFFTCVLWVPGTNLGSHNDCPEWLDILSCRGDDCNNSIVWDWTLCILVRLYQRFCGDSSSSEPSVISRITRRDSPFCPEGGGKFPLECTAPQPRRHSLYSPPSVKCCVLFAFLHTCPVYFQLSDYHFFRSPSQFIS